MPELLSLQKCNLSRENDLRDDIFARRAVKMETFMSRTAPDYFKTELERKRTYDS